MSIQSISGVQFILASHRCHQYLLDFVVATSSIFAYMNVYHNQPVSSYAPHLKNGASRYPTSVFEIGRAHV